MGKAARSKREKKAAAPAKNGVGSAVRQSDLDFSAPDDAYTGTFRWKAGKKFMKLPEPRAGQVVRTDKAGWGEFLPTRCPGDASVVDRVRADPSVLDGVSYAVTLVHMLQRSEYPIESLRVAGRRKLTVLVLGAAARCEERIARETEYWDELGHLLELKVELVLVGPEVSGNETLKPSSPTSLTTITLFRGTFLGYQEGRELDPGSTVLVTFNGGFGNWVESRRFGLFLSWFEDLVAIASSNLPAFFTQANDYADLVGEVAIFTSAINTQFFLAPARNAFSAASHMAEPNRPESWACANSTFFGIQGGRKSGAAVALEMSNQGDRDVLTAIVSQRAGDEDAEMPGVVPLIVQGGSPALHAPEAALL
eukprot:TRINITY_DN6730_c0_g1_i7.p1 TRINITY_DN6730_c0_g1~~TRINITY_DN6730_c0_g1_i7.p1  ORF type:complete len:366 (+),score=74.20 TRINITY_DN6730_c0_g1_i7:145-1242(+)